MSFLLPVWHWEVHEEFQESLYFYHFRITPYIRKAVEKQLKDFFTKYDLSAFCFYEIIGGLDMLLCVWLRSEQERKFERQLRTDVAGVNNVFTHKVLDFVSPGPWKNAQVDRRVLRRLSEEQIRNVQIGEATDLTGQLREAGLLNDVRIGSNLINLFVYISPPEFRGDLTRDELLMRTTQLCDEYETQGKLIEPWVYLVHGEQWALITAKTQDFFVVGPFVGDLASILTPFGSYNTTFLATGNLLEENGNVSESTLTAARGKDLAVARLLPELYVTSVQDRLKREIEEWVRSVVIPAGLDEENERIITSCLLGVIKKDEREIRRALFDFFTDLESYLKANWARLVTSLLGKKKLGDMLQSAGVERGLEPKFLSLSHLCTIYTTCIRQSDKIQDKNILVGWSEIVDLRNKVMHGEEERFEPLATWEADLKQLVEFMGRYHLLRELVKGIFQ